MSDTSITTGIRRFWWIPLITGLIGIGLGIWTLCCPQTSIPVLAYAFAVCMLVAGVLNLAFTGAATWAPNRWWSCAMGLLEIICGVWLLCMPEQLLVVTFIIVVGVWILVAAINALCEAFMISQRNPWQLAWAILLLFATIILAGMFLYAPAVGAEAVWLYLGISFITFGCYRMILAFGLRKATRIF